MNGNGNNGNGQKYSRGESFSAAALMNRSTDHAFDSPGGIAFRLNPDGYGGAKNSAERERVASFVNNWIERTKDPASDIPGAPPLFGQDVAPHAMTFASKIGSQAKTYLPSDESLEANPNDALLMRKDLGIMECLEIRQRMSALLDWSIVPEDTKSPAQKSVAAELTKIVKRVRRFTEYKRCLMDAIWIGRSAIQHTYGDGNIGGKMYCYPRARHADATGWKHIHGDKIVFRYDDGEKLSNGAFADQMGICVSPVIQKDSRIRGIQDLEYTNSGAAIFLSPAERQTIICHKHMIEDAEYQNPRKAGRIHGVGIRDRIYNEWFLKQEMLGFLMEYMERSAGGIEIYEYPSGDEAAKRSIMEAAKNRMAFGRNQIFFPKPLGMDAGVYDIRIVEPGFAGMDMLVNILDKYFGHRIKRYIIGQTLSTEADATGLGSSVADFQKDSLAQIVMYDSSNLEETLTHELVRPIHLANWPETESWQFELKLELESDNVKEKLDSYRTAWEMGLGIPEKDVAEAIGVSLDNPNEKMLKNAQAGGMGAGMGNGMQFPPGTGFGNQIDAAHEHVKAAGEVKAAQQGVIDHVAGKVNGDQGEESGPPSSPAVKSDQYSREFSEADHPRDESGKFTASKSSPSPADNNDDSSINSLPDYKNAQPRLISETKTPMGKVSIVSGDYKKELKFSPGEFVAETFAQVWRGHEMLEEFSSSDPDEALENAQDLYNDTIEHARRKGEAVDSGEESGGIGWNVHHDGKGMMEIYVFGPDGNVIHRESGFDAGEEGEAVEAAKRIAQEMGEELTDDEDDQSPDDDESDDPEKYQRRSHRLLSEAASSTHTSPTPAQREAGNYAKGIFPWKGLEIAIENPKGSTRSGVSPSTGREWSRTMASHYGYFRRTKANDGDNLDVFIGPHPDSEFVLVIKQVDQDGDFDEFKVVVGCLNRKEAKRLYLANYPKGWKCGPAASMTVELFKKWVEKGGPMKARSLAKVEKYGREFEPDNDSEKNTLIAEIFQHFYGDDASSMLDEVEPENDQYKRIDDVDYYSWIRRWDEEEHPRNKAGKFTKKGSAENTAAIHSAIDNELKTGERSPESAKRLVDYLSGLSVKELHELKKKYGVSASGVKAELIEKIAKRLDSGRRADQSKNPESISNSVDNKIDEGGKKVDTPDVERPLVGAAENAEDGGNSGERNVRKEFTYEEPGYKVDVSFGYYNDEVPMVYLKASAGGKSNRYSTNLSSNIEPIDEMKKRLGSKFPTGVSNASHFVFGGALFRNGVKEKLKESLVEWRKSESERAAQVTANEPEGLQELRDAISDQSRYADEFQGMMEDEHNDGVRPPKPVVVSATEVAKKYPAAAAWLKAESFTQSSNVGKYSAGKTALKRMKAGEDPVAVAVDMEKEWTDYAMNAVD